MTNKTTVLAMALLTAMSGGAWAKHHPQHAVSHGKRAPVVLGQHPVLTVCGVSAYDASQRAEIVQTRLEQALQAGLPVSGVTLQKAGHVLVIRWSGRLVTTVDELQCRGHHMKPWALANLWVESIRHAAASQTFSVSEKTVMMAVGNTHTLQMSGELPGATTATVDTATATAQVDNRAHTVSVHGVKAGNVVLTLKRGAQKVAVQVAVRDLAGQIPADLACVVTGDPAPKAVLTDALLYAIKGGVHPTSGAKIYLHGDPPLPDTLAAGQQTVLSLPITLDGPDLISVKRTVRVTVQNRPTLMSDAALLMVSNRPETLDGNGVVFTGQFGPGRPARLFYAHTNGSSTMRQISVTLTNRSDKPAEVLLVGVPGSPEVNPLLAATGSESLFLQRSAESAGVILTIPPRTGWQVLQSNIPPQQRVVGLAHLECLSGADIDVTVQARENHVPLAVASRTMLAEGASQGHPKGTFASPNQQLQSTYKAGDPAEIVALGQGPALVDTSSGEGDVGQYGVLYHVSLKLTNPSPQPHTVDIAFGAGDNPSRACFLLEGRTQDTELVPANTEAPLETVALGPNDTRTVELTTLGMPGTSLPAHLVVRTAADAPAAVLAPPVVVAPPPVTAPSATAPPTQTPVVEAPAAPPTSTEVETRDPADPIITPGQPMIPGAR